MKLFAKKAAKPVPRRRFTDDTTKTVVGATFNRGRTISGHVTHYLDNLDVKVDEVSHRTRAHNLADRRRKITFVLLAVILSCAILWVVVSNFTASVKITVSDTAISRSIDDKPYKKAISDYFGLNPLSRFSFLLDDNKLAEYVSSVLPEVEDVTYGGMSTIGKTKFIFKMRQPVAGWEINSNQYYVDAKGIAFETNYYTSDSIVQIVDNSGASIQTGKASVSKRFLSFVGLVVSTAKSSGYTVNKATLPLNTTRELDVNINEVPYLIKLSIDRGAGEQITDMDKTIKYLASKYKVPAYIDIRVNGKAFYK